MTIRVRFAPSPTGYLHIGGARTALFNYLFARHHDGAFLLRIEDTDKARSTDDAIRAIHEGLAWLGLLEDEQAVLQSSRVDRHQEVVRQLIDRGHAYACYMSAEELAHAREEAQSRGEMYRYDGRWRDKPLGEDTPAWISPSFRLKAPKEGSLTLHDAVQGSVTVAYSDLDDMVLMRSDGTPTYLLAVVVDDHDMGITHIIRGDDHFTNSFRQAMIYDAMGWTLPQLAHIPLIHGADGAKLSKRHGALGVDAYRDMGYLPEAVRNYLLRLGWSHGDDEIISDEQAIAWFDLDGLGKSPSRFDMDKLNHINAHYLRAAELDRILTLAQPFIEQHIGRALDATEQQRLRVAMPELQTRAHTLVELAEQAAFYFVAPAHYSEKAHALIATHRDILCGVHDALHLLEQWDAASIQQCCTDYGASVGQKLGGVMNPIRAAITGSHASPSMFGVMELLGKNESLQRIKGATL
ncbi:MAG: glutamate--tRNA ligase [Alphaproteobacteria bacterium]|nr:MAG: glutamate--tRNA ligase [Alphaproteobacteria bacterium]TAF16054.1 MAG: glutamate--tRNA ligase [Alphaproteobacteria bacterium]TAF40640.1 MAG: glutamate--tRNA ligase [Alphaproteobacteria bacterium]TAF75938.1 MAG: glutamate--tRNA ligase [Alphaproteobacteria bacterium]